MNSNKLNKKKLYSQCESILGDRDGSQLDLFLGGFNNNYSEIFKLKYSIIRKQGISKGSIFHGKSEKPIKLIVHE